MPAIEWLGWGGEAFARARRADRPILLALVAPWCEHCARMDRTTYARAEVVRLLDERFVAVRVDSDRRPDLNERYNLGGWPTTAFLTPDGLLFGGGTFIDADRMPDVLTQVSETFAGQRAEIEARARETEPPPAVQPAPRAPADDDPVEWLSCRLLDLFDGEAGGFGDGPKFPHVAALTLALDRYTATGNPALARVLTGSLDALVRLFDPIEGGFFRYASRRDWSAPHTEKVLRENAQLVRLHLEAGAALGRPDYLDRAVRTIAWVRRALAGPGAWGFAASQAADTAYYGADTGMRESHGAPPADATRYADANAEMIAALLRAADIVGDPSLRDVALATLEQALVSGYQPGDGIAHVLSPDADVRGLLSDQMHMAEALLAAHAATHQLPYSMLAAELVEYAIRTMWDEAAGGFRDRAARPDDEPGLLGIPLRPFALNCESARVLFRLALVTGRAAHRDRAVRTLAGLGAGYVEDPLLGAAYGLAVREVRDGCLPAGLSLSYVDWKLAEPDDP